MKYEKWLIGVIVLSCVLYRLFFYCPTPKWAYNYLGKLDLFLRTDTLLSNLTGIAITIFLICLILSVCLVPVMIGLLGIAAKKSKDYLYGGLIAICCVLSAWKIWVVSRSLHALYAFFYLALDRFFS